MESGRKSNPESYIGLPTSQKGRGRPKKHSNTAEQEYQRNRLRRAQIAYRKRKETHLSGLEQRCEDLEHVVEQMTNEFINFSDRLISSGSSNAENIRDVRSVLGRFLELSKQAAKHTDNEPFAEVSRDFEKSQNFTQSEGLNLDNEDVPPPPAVTLPIMGSTFLDISKTFAPATTVQRFAPMKQTSSVTTGFSDPYINTFWTPPITPDMDNSIIPHVLSGRDSFSSRLYYETINLAVRSLKGEAPWRYAASIFRYKLQYASREQLFGVLAGVLDMLLLGTNQVKEGGVPQRVVDGDGAVKDGIIRQIVAQGGSEDQYLPSWEVERYLRERWAFTLDSSSVRIQQRRIQEFEDGPEPSLPYERAGFDPTSFAPTVIPGFPAASQVILNSERLLDELKKRALTVGAGPRWHVTSIDDAVNVFLRQNNTIHVAQI
ncbi:hypothetical protein GLAREA_09745 [Glarea lozoyensis ATCC 20868]|uniref:BZIP domain-containing protein n=1 Tax=Glarea lozoyensis (strain ATCC 20868 / MF5171) TaxID=1116229 RepID=S3CUD7_GLAL2|nr:uncharacterized protein GLAREA_09745 [Glarea lozoyensis ATCC 20868]EPE28624.1 hypothetical protein GLAREA_09745 [Glarea lozoyensis ATCC 20868]